MEEPETQGEDEVLDSESENEDKPRESVDTASPLPLLITLIGIFCYLGVVLPSVFESSSTMFDYTTFDIVLMIGGAALVGLGAYFWFKARVKTMGAEEDAAAKSL
ncbi:MAG: hypothetical protein JSW28_04120 [Thermoplasmata archaeon]|nr:MAG: hypothetical protein JSW28_04120 [Thermoplasmata archaeon]